ncbi:MAG: trigger factor [Bradymonadaceae bacterium]
MSHEVEEVDEVTRRARVTVPEDEFEARMDAHLEELADDVDMPGFRDGNVPTSLLRKRFGDQVEGQIVEGFLRERLDEILADYADRLLYVGDPTITEAPEGDAALEIELEFELRPELDPVGYLGVAVEKPQPEVDSEEVDEQIENLREEHATLEPIPFRNNIEEGDVVTFDFEPAEDREELSDFQGEDVQVEIGGDPLIPEFTEALTGAEFDSTLTVEVTPDESFPDEELRGESFDVTLDVKSVKSKQLPEPNDAFAKDTGEAETMLELRSQIRDELEEYQEDRAKHAAEAELIDALLEQQDVPLPPQFFGDQLEQELEQRQQRFEQQGITLEEAGIEPDEFRERVEEELERDLKQEFLLLAIAEKEGLEVEDDDLDAFFEHQAQHDRRLTAEQLRQYAEQDEQRMQSIRLQALLQKTRDYLLAEAEFLEPEDEEDDEAAEPTGDAGAEDETTSDDETTESDED